MEERRHRVRQYEQLVLQHLRRLLTEEEREYHMTEVDGRRIFVGDVRLGTGEGGNEAVVLFRKAGLDGLFGFSMPVEEPSDSEEPVEPEAELWADAILTNTDEAVSLTSRGSRDGPDGRTNPGGVRWVW